MKKRWIARMLAVVFVMVSVLSPMGGKNVRAEEEEDREYSFSTSPGIYTPVQVDEFYFNDITLSFDGYIYTLQMDVIKCQVPMYRKSYIKMYNYSSCLI